MRHVLVLTITLLLIAACKDAPKKADEGQAASTPPPTIQVTAARTDLVFSYPAQDGFATASTIDAIPESARRQVVVTDLSLSPAERQADRYLYLANLEAPRADGSYPVALASRYGFEATLTASAAVALTGSTGVIVYSTSWCGVCKKAKRLLGSWGVPFVEKDVEGSKRAAEELASKAAAAGIRPGGVPVIDVGGVLLQGLDEATLRNVLTEQGLL